MVPFQQMVYVEDKDKYYPVDEVPKDEPTSSTSPAPSCATASHEGRDIPSWFTYPGRGRRSCAAAIPPAPQQGFTVFFTGLSGSGKSHDRQRAAGRSCSEIGGRPVTLLDGDLVRKHLSRELGFSKEHRDINIRRIGYVASEITKNGGIAICAPIAPYDDDPQGRPRDDRAPRRLHPRPRRHLASRCARSATARASTPRPAPASSRSSPASPIPTRSRPTPKLHIDTAELSPEEAAQEIILHLEREGFIGMNRNHA